MKAARRVRMRKMRKVCGSKCMVFFVSVLSHASMTSKTRDKMVPEDCTKLRFDV